MEENKKYMKFQENGYILGFFDVDKHGEPLETDDYVWVANEVVEYVCSTNASTLKRKTGDFYLSKVYIDSLELFDIVEPESIPVDITPTLQERIDAVEMALLMVL